MAKIEFSERARAELVDIYTFGYRRFGERQAERYIDQFEHVFELIAENPEWAAEPNCLDRTSVGTSTGGM